MMAKRHIIYTKLFSNGGRGDSGNETRTYNQSLDTYIVDIQTGYNYCQSILDTCVHIDTADP